MAVRGTGAVVRQIEALYRGGSVAGLTDAQLLDRFASREDRAIAEAAFEAIVARHGPMVLGVCRRLARDPIDAEDAFQATFLVLARRAASVRVDDSLGRWLHGVSRRVASRARRRAAERRDATGPTPPEVASSDPGPLDVAIAGERAGLVRSEVDRLPDRYREAVVLCHLEGRSIAEAAARLGRPAGTIKVRLSRARALLRDRLARRGLAPVVLPVVPASLIHRTVQAAVRDAFRAGGLAGAVASGTVLNLAEGVIAMTGWAKVQAAGVALLSVGVTVAAVGGLAAREGKQAGPEVAEGPIAIAPAPGLQEGQPAAEPPAGRGPDRDLAELARLRAERARLFERYNRLWDDLERTHRPQIAALHNDALQSVRRAEEDHGRVERVRAAIRGAIDAIGPDDLPADKARGRPGASMPGAALVIETYTQLHQLSLKAEFAEIEARSEWEAARRQAPSGDARVWIERQVEQAFLSDPDVRELRAALQALDDPLQRAGGRALPPDRAEAPPPDDPEATRDASTPPDSAPTRDGPRPAPRSPLGDGAEPSADRGRSGRQRSPFDPVPRTASGNPLVPSRGIPGDDRPTRPTGDPDQPLSLAPEPPKPASPSDVPPDPGPGRHDEPDGSEGRPGTPPEWVPPAEPRSSEDDAEAAPEYVVEPPDLIRIEVLEALPGRPITGERLVRPDGRVSLDFYGELHVAGRTLSEIKEKVVLHLRRFLTDESLGLVELNGRTLEYEMIHPKDSNRVFVDVTTYNSKPYYVQGDVAAPGRFNVTGRDSILDAITYAGGLLPTADPTAIRLIRPPGPGGDPPAEILPIDWEAIVERGDPATNYLLRPGDRIIVPRKDVTSAETERRIERAFLAHDDVRGLHQDLRDLDERIDKISRMVRNPGDPALARLRFERQRLLERYNQLWVDLWPILRVQVIEDPEKITPAEPRIGSPPPIGDDPGEPTPEPPKLDEPRTEAADPAGPSKIERAPETPGETPDPAEPPGADAEELVALGPITDEVPDLVLELVGPELRTVGSTAEYTVTIANRGRATATDVAVALFAPSSGDPKVPADAKHRQDPERRLHCIYWRLPRLDKGESRQYRVPIRLDRIVNYHVEVAAHSEGFREPKDTRRAYRATQVIGIPDVKIIDVSRTDPVIDAGDTTEFAITIKNVGAMEATNVQVDFFTGGPVEVEQTDPDDVRTNPEDPEHHGFAPIDRLAPEAERTFVVTVKARRPGPAVATIEARVFWDGLPEEAAVRANNHVRIAEDEPNRNEAEAPN